MPSSTDKFRLGRAAVFSVNGTVLSSVREIGVRRVTTEVDATGFGHSSRSSVITHRTYEIDVAVLSVPDVTIMQTAEANETPILVVMGFGHTTLSTYFRIHETTADEPLNDAVVATFALREWSEHPV